MAEGEAGGDFPWHIGIFDAHCHPTDTVNSLQGIPSMRAKVLTIMATRAQDQQLVADAADQYGITKDDADNTEMDYRNHHKIVPSFGWHPWFSHQMYDESEYGDTTRLTEDQKVAHYQSVLSPPPDEPSFSRSLPDPRPFSDFLSQTGEYLDRYPLALVGEVGLDKSFRIPEAWLPEQADTRDDGLTPGGREGRTLSRYRVSMEHQRKVLRAQLRLAGEKRRAVSTHGVQAHGVVYETLAETWKGHEKQVLSNRDRKKQGKITEPMDGVGEGEEQEVDPSSPLPYPPRVCLHSYSGPAEAIKQYIAPSVPCEVFFSFSTTINAWSESGDGKVEAALRAVPDERILVESDLHTAGEDMDQYLEAAVRTVCRIKGWQLVAGVTQLRENWRAFVFGQR